MSSNNGRPRSVDALFEGRSKQTLVNYKTNYRTLWRKLEGNDGRNVPDDVINDLTWVTRRAGDIAALLAEELRKGTDPATVHDYAQRTLVINKHLPGERMDPIALHEIGLIDKEAQKAKSIRAKRGSARVDPSLPTVRDLKDNFRVLDRVLDFAIEHNLSPTKISRLANAHAVYGFFAYNTDIALRKMEMAFLAIGLRDNGNFIDPVENVMVLRNHKTVKNKGTRIIELRPGYGEVLLKSLRAYPRETFSGINTPFGLANLTKDFFVISGLSRPNMKEIREIVLTNVHATAGLRSPQEIKQILDDAGTSADFYMTNYNLSGDGYGKKAVEAVSLPPREQSWVEQTARDFFSGYVNKNT